MKAEFVVDESMEYERIMEANGAVGGRNVSGPRYI
jgi:hypothetical protein